MLTNHVGFYYRGTTAERAVLSPQTSSLFYDTDVSEWFTWDGSAWSSQVHRSQWLQNGFLDATEASLAWADGGPTLTVDAVGASFSYLHDGVLYTKTGPQTKTIDGTEGMWIFYFDGATLTAANAPNHAKYDDVWLNEAVVALLYWDATNNDGRLMYELHGARKSPATHHWIHDHIGSDYLTGMALADFVIDDDGDDAEDAQFSIASGEFSDEDIDHSLAAINKTTGAEIWYLDGANWRWTTNAGYSILTTGTGRMAWNNAGAQAEVGNNDFALCHIFATTIGDDAGENPKYIAVQGQATYATKKLARAGAETEINALAFGTLPLQEIIPVGTVIFQSSNGYGNAVKSRTVTTEAGDDYEDWRASNIKASGGSIATHNSIPGLQGGTAGEYYHLTDAQNAATAAMVTAGLDALTTAEVNQLENIGAATISEAQWGYLGALDQSLIQAASPTFADMFLPDGGTIGIDGNELLTFNAAGTAAFSGVGSVQVPDGAWVGADAACSWVFDSTNGDVSTLDRLGVGTRTPGAQIELSETAAGINANMFIRARQENERRAQLIFLVLNSVGVGGGGAIGSDGALGGGLILAGVTGIATPHIYIDIGGNVGINRSEPQGRLHGYDTISGFLHWEYDGVDGTARTVIPNAAGDVVYVLTVLYAIRVSNGEYAGAEQTVAPGNSITLYSFGGDTCTLAVAADGTVTVQRTAGALTYKVALWLLWI